MAPAGGGAGKRLSQLGGSWSSLLGAALALLYRWPMFLRPVPVLVLLAWLAEDAAARVERESSFDWDGNVVFMPTRIYLKGPEGEVAFSPGEYVRISERVGKPGPYQHLTVDHDPLHGSYRDMFDVPGRNLFLDELQVAVREGRFGPEWRAFVRATATRRGAMRTTIITARSQSAETIHAGILWLKKIGLIKHAPPRRNIFPVTSPGFALKGRVLSGSSESRKLEVIRGRIANLAARRLPRGTARVFRYSDDYLRNILVAHKFLAGEPRGPVEVRLRFSDRAHPIERATTLVLRPRPSSKRTTGGIR
jgi:hypothetical protein